MSVELSRRLARVVHQPPIVRLSHRERWVLGIAAERASCFSDLSEHHQRLILEAEAARERTIVEQRAAVRQ